MPASASASTRRRCGSSAGRARFPSSRRRAKTAVRSRATSAKSYAAHVRSPHSVEGASRPQEPARAERMSAADYRPTDQLYLWLLTEPARARARRRAEPRSHDARRVAAVCRRVARARLPAQRGSAAHRRGIPAGRQGNGRGRRRRRAARPLGRARHSLHRQAAAALAARVLVLRRRRPVRRARRLDLGDRVSAAAAWGRCRRSATRPHPGADPQAAGRRIGAGARAAVARAGRHDGRRTPEGAARHRRRAVGRQVRRWRRDRRAARRARGHDAGAGKPAFASQKPCRCA